MIFLCECIEWFGYASETSDKGTIKIAKAQKGADILDLYWHRPVLNTCNFDGVHVSHPLFKDYPQVIYMQGMEDTFFRFEIQVMVSHKLEDIVHCSCMSVDCSAGGYSNIIHIDLNSSTEKLMLSYDGGKNVIHHGLEGCQRIGETKKHDKGLVKAILCLECSFVFIPFFDANIVVSPSNVQFGIDICAT